MKIKVLLADDEKTFKDMFVKVLVDEGMDVIACDDGLEAIEAIGRESFDVAILDIQMPGADGIKVLREIMSRDPEARVVMLTAFGTVEMAVEAIKLGACDYVMKPVMFDDILIKIRQQYQYRRLKAENEELKSELHGRFGFENIIGESSAMRRVFDTVQKVANTHSNVLITGDSGTGKEVVAHAIHSLSGVKAGRFVAINCGAISEGLLESELFGHKRGSFTSAIADKKGLFETAEGGTLFLDEIGYMTVACQVKLLRAVEERCIMPVGSTETVSINVRVIAATNRDLLNEIKAGRFREDLYYRLNVVGIHLPSLGERKDDIGLLVEHFIKVNNSKMGKNCTGVSDEAMQVLMNYEWKGNVRELQNVLERAIIFAEGDIITVSDIGLTGSGSSIDTSETRENLQDAMRIYEREHILRVLKKCEGDKSQAAKTLNIGLSSLYRKITELGIGDDK